MRILIADDNEINRQFIRGALESEPYEIDEACNGREAVLQANRQIYDVILMDIRMPEVDGIEATRQILALPIYQSNKVRIIALTADLQLRQQTDLERQGFDTCLAKPVSRSTLLDILHQRVQTTAGNGQTTSCPIDHATALAAAGGNQALLDKLTTMLGKEIEQFQPLIATALEHQDWPKARDMVHKVGGSAAYCGARVLQRAAAEMERALKQSEAGQIATSGKDFFAAMNELADYLRTL